MLVLNTGSCCLNPQGHPTLHNPLPKPIQPSFAYQRIHFRVHFRYEISSRTDMRTDYIPSFQYIPVRYFKNVDTTQLRPDRIGLDRTLETGLGFEIPRYYMKLTKTHLSKQKKIFKKIKCYHHKNVGNCQCLFENAHKYSKSVLHCFNKHF